MMRVAAVIPALDEADAIADVVRGLLRADACCVFVVDGGSRDRTRELAAAAGARVIEERRRGYGRACLTGAAAAAGTDHDHDAIGFLDGDGSCDPRDLAHLCAGLRSADLVLGRRRPRDIESQAMPIHARLGNDLVAALISLRTHRRVHDLPPYKVIRSELLDRIGLDATGYGWTVQLVARACMDRSARIREVPVRFLRRRGGVSKVAGQLRASVLAAIAMLQGAWVETLPRPALALVAKAPRPGAVKTRLIPELGAAAAAELWSASLADTAASIGRAASDLRGERILVCRPDERGELKTLLGSGWTVAEQARPGLEGAIGAAFEAVAAAGGDRALVISGDNPDLPPSHLASALRTLDQHPAVLGPTTDGGYHLVGLRWRRIPRLPIVGPILRAALARHIRLAFASVAMGTDGALEATRRSLSARGWDAVTSPTWPDLDTPDDLRELAERLASLSVEVAPRTRAWLAEREAATQATAVEPAPMSVGTS